MLILFLIANVVAAGFAVGTAKAGAATTVSVSASPSPATAGQAVTLTATSSVPGTVTFSYGGSVIGTGTAVGAGALTPYAQAWTYTGNSISVASDVDANGNVAHATYNGDDCTGGRCQSKWMTPAGSVSYFANQSWNTAGRVISGIAIAPNGKIYESVGSLNKVYVRTAFNQNTSDFLSAPVVSGPCGLETDSSNNLYVANRVSGTILKVTDAGVVTTYATGITKPCGITLNQTTGVLYVADGNGDILTVPSGGGTPTLLVAATCISTDNLGIGSQLAIDPSGYVYGRGCMAGSMVTQISPTGVLVNYLPDSANHLGPVSFIGGWWDITYYNGSIYAGGANATGGNLMRMGTSSYRAVLTHTPSSGGSFALGASLAPTDSVAHDPSTGSSTLLVRPSSPQAPDLVAASDLGSSPTDDTTSDATPTFEVPGSYASGNTITVTATRAGFSNVSCTYVVPATSCTLGTLAAGTWSITATDTHPTGGTSAAGPALSIVVDTTAPSAPTAVDLVAGSDTGTSSTDDKTADNTPTMGATGGASGETVTLTASKTGSADVSCSYVVPATSCTLGTLADGTWNVRATVTDVAGNTSVTSAALSVEIDTSGPGAIVPDLVAASDTGASSTDDLTSDSTPTMTLPTQATGDVVTFTASRAGYTSVTCTYTVGTASNCTLGSLADGTWSISATVTDLAGNTGSTASLAVSVDATAPSPPAAPDLAASSDTGSSDTDNLTNDTTPALSIPGANTGETVEFTATQGATTRTCSYVVGVASSCDISPALGTGTWSVTARVTDAAGNQSVSGPATSLSIDTTAPSAPGAPDLAASSDLGSSSTDNLTSDMTPTMSASGGTAGDTMTITATQGATTRSCSYVVGTSSSCDLPTLGDGTWTVAATLTDQAGNVSSAGSGPGLQIDGTAPSFSGGPDLVASSDSGASNSDNLTNDTTPTLSIPGGSTGDVATISATNGSVTRSCSYTIGSTTSCDLSPALTDGTWSVSGTLTDPAGNVVATVPSLSLSVDATAPSPASVDLAASSDTGSSTTDDLTSDSSPTISVPGLSVGDQVTVTAQRGSTVVNCSYTVGAASSCDLPMIADGTWSVTAAITDAAGNAGATVAPLSISIDTTGPAPPGALDLAASSDTGSSSADDATSDTTPSMSVPGGTAGDTATVSATNGTQTVSCTFVVGSASSCDLPALTDGTWQLSGTLTDPAGNTSAAGPALPLVVDTTPPAIGRSPDLLSSSDTGVSSTDNVTSDTTPSIEIPGVEDGASVIVTATKGSSTVTCTFVASATWKGCDLPALTDGTWSLTASATDARGNTASTAQPLSLKIDTAKPFGDPVNTSGGTPGVTTTTTAPRRPSSGATTTTTPRRPSNSSSPTTTVTRRPGSTTPTTAPKPKATAPKPTTTTTVAPSPFGMPDLRTESDTGADRGDNLTNATSPLVGIDGLGDGDTVTLVAKRGARAVQCSYVVGAADGCRLEGLADGEWKVGARVVDLAGNEADAPETLALSLDSLGPADQLSLSTTDDPDDGSMFVDVAGGDDGRGVTVTASNGNDTVTCSFVVSGDTRGCLLEGMTPGEWKITGVAFDEAGNASGEATALDAVVAAPTTVPPPTNPPATVPAGDQDGEGSDAARTVDPMSTDDTIALLASMLALLAISRRGAMGEPRRLDSDERQSTEVTGFAAGAGSGGLDARRDRFVPPNIPRLDRTMYEKARDWSPLSPALGRSLDDGSYVRALVGVFWSLLPVAGGVLGVVAALDTDSVAMLPALGIFVALLVVGTLDAFAGLVGVATYAVTLLAGGGLGTADSLRGFFGMAAPMFLVGLVASAMRPFRRETGEHPVWNRSADAVLIALIGAWAAGTMYQAVPHLSGYDVEWSGRVGTVELVALVTLVVRYGLENIARLVVADRLRAIENETLPEPGDAQLTVSRIVRAVLFAFVAYVFVGGNVWLAAGTAMFLVPKILEPLTDRLPNAATLYRFLPRDLVRTVLMLFVMLWWGGLVADAVESNEVQWAFVLMSIPGIALGVADWFARDGKSWPSTVVTRVLGVVTLLIGVAFVRGWIF